MKPTHSFRDITIAAFRFQPWVIVATLLSFLMAALLQISWQYQESKEAFLEASVKLEKNLLLEEQSTETLLKALAQYYSSQVIKSDDAFSRFAESLVPQHPYISVFGISQLVHQEDWIPFQRSQKEQGYSSYSTQNKRLFKESVFNFSGEYLSITRVLPLDPKHSIYMGEDLFTLPKLQKELNALSRENRIGLYWLQHRILNRQLVLLSHPIYNTSPNSMTADERQKNTLGNVFILFDITPFLINTSKNYIRNLHSIELNINHHPLKHDWNIYQHSENSDHPETSRGATVNFWQNGFKQLAKQLTFNTRISTSALRNNIELRLEAAWDYRNIDGQFATLFGILGMMLFILGYSLIRIFTGYARSLFKMQSRLEEILHTSHDAVIITNHNGTILSWNPRAEELFGFKQHEILGTSIIELFTQLSENNLQDPVEQKLAALFINDITLHQQLQINAHEKLLELYLFNRQQQRILIEISYSILSVNESVEISLFIQDITCQRKTESEIKQLAYYDALTNLENRVLFKQNFESLISRPTPPEFSVYFIDLDGFKQVNDTLGHNIGDELLKVIARRIVNTTQGAQKPYHICRFGGDEFVIMVETIEANLTHVLLERLLQKIQRLIRIEGNELQVSASIGVTFYPEHGKDMDTLLRHADTAMYEAKNLGKNTFSVYQNEMTEHLSQRLLLEKHLRSALAYKEFKLVYQPQMDLQTGQIIGVEALIRWHNNSLGFIRPDQFIPIAEESRMIIEIGDWVVDTCIDQLKAWRNTSQDGLPIAINVSSVQFNSPGFVDGVYEKMRHAGLPSNLLEIELTERTVMDNADENVERFNDIRNQGFGLSVDDFGTGYSSLSYLKLFPLTILKIDKSFVDGLPTDDNDISIANAILNLAHSLNIKVVAEGVETIEQLLFLKDAGCNYAQGYFISRPLPVEEFELWLTQQTHYFYTSPVYHQAINAIQTLPSPQTCASST